MSARQVNRKQLTGAMGTRDGDFLELQNQWAKVFIEKRDGKYVVSGDLLPSRDAEREWDTISSAMAYALQSLEAYQTGACR